MTRASERPNCVLAADYRKCLDATGLEYQLLVTRLAGAGDVDPHLPYEEIPPTLRARSLAYVRSVRDRFARSLRSPGDEDLSVAGLFVIAKAKT